MNAVITLLHLIDMAKKRTPNQNRNSVLKEFEFRCAICGKSSPEIHHIDENPSNHEINNLIPLCSNFHRTTQHNPHKKIEPQRLRLFRIFKEPKILLNQFKPIYSRLIFLEEISNDSNIDIVANNANDLIKFLSHLEMGSYFSQKLSRLLERKIVAAAVYVDPEHNRRSPSPSKDCQKESDENYIKDLIAYKEKIYDLIIRQQLQYQQWNDEIIHLCDGK